MYIHIYIVSTCTRFKSKITRYVKCFVPEISTSKNFFKEIGSVNSNAPGRSTSFKQRLVALDEIYLQNEKFKRSLYNHLMKSKTK